MTKITFIIFFLIAISYGLSAQNDSTEVERKSIKNSSKRILKLGIEIGEETETIVKNVGKVVKKTFKSGKHKVKKISDTIISRQEQKDSLRDWQMITVFKYFREKRKERKEEKPEEISDFYDMDWDDMDSLMAVEGDKEMVEEIDPLTNIGTQTELSTRHTPSVVTIISEEDIKNLGARDLIDILRLVPGFDFALDDKGRVGLGIRGNWANEGKVLLMIDGQEMNDVFAAKLFFGMHYPVDIIKRIEVIRGPGSAIYGGFAEFGVINIITKNPDDHNGMSFYANYGRTASVNAHATGSIYYGKKWKNADLMISNFAGYGARSDQESYAFYDIYKWKEDSVGNKASLKKNSEIYPNFTNIYFRRKKLKIRLISDFYDVTDVTLLDQNDERPYRNGNSMSYFEVKRPFNLGKRLSLTPQINTVAQFTQFQHEDNGEITSYNYTFRGKYKMTGNYRKNHRQNYTFGIEYFRDSYKVENDSTSLRTIENDLSYNNMAAFGQGFFRTPMMNIIAGIRYERNSSFGSSYVPRFGLTKKIGNFHIKLLACRAFRAPAVANIVMAFDGNYEYNADTTGFRFIGNKIKPEKTKVFEIEAGYVFDNNLSFRINYYNINIENPIAYYYFSNEAMKEVLNNRDYGYIADYYGEYIYQNFDKAGSKGLELDLSFKDCWGKVNLNYSYYSTTSDKIIPPNSISTFSFDADERIRTQSNQVLGFAKHKINLNTYFYINENLSLNISSSLYSKKYGYDVQLDENGMPDGILQKEQPQILLNTYINYRNFLIKRLNLGFGVYDILNQKYEFYQPYFGVNVPLPSLSREFYFKLSYDLNFKNKLKTKN